MVPKCVLFFLSSMQCNLLATYPVWISTIFQTTDVIRCPGAYSLKSFCAGSFSGHKKNTKFWVNLDGVQLKQHSFR